MYGVASCTDARQVQAKHIRARCNLWNHPTSRPSSHSATSVTVGSAVVGAGCACATAATILDPRRSPPSIEQGLIPRFTPARRFYSFNRASTLAGIPIVVWAMP